VGSIGVLQSSRYGSQRPLRFIIDKMPHAGHWLREAPQYLEYPI
jgi:hypothetical protein